MKRFITYILVLLAFQLLADEPESPSHADGSDSKSSKKERAEAEDSKSTPPTKCVGISATELEKKVNESGISGTATPEQLTQLKKSLPPAKFSRNKNKDTDITKCLPGVSSKVIEQIQLALMSDDYFLTELAGERAANPNGSEKIKRLEKELERRMALDPLAKRLKEVGAGTGDNFQLMEMINNIREAVKNGNHEHANYLATGLVNSVALSAREKFKDDLEKGVMGSASSDKTVAHLRAALRAREARGTGKVDFSDLGLSGLSGEKALENMNNSLERGRKMGEMVTQYNRATNPEDREAIAQKIRREFGPINLQRIADHVRIESEAGNKDLGSLDNTAQVALHNYRVGDKGDRWAMKTHLNPWKEGNPEALQVVDKSGLRDYLERMGRPDVEGRGSLNTHFDRLTETELKSVNKVVNAIDSKTGRIDSSKIENLGQLDFRVRVAVKDGNQLAWDKVDPTTGLQYTVAPPSLPPSELPTPSSSPQTEPERPHHIPDLTKSEPAKPEVRPETKPEPLPTPKPIPPPEKPTEKAPDPEPSKAPEPDPGEQRKKCEGYRQERDEERRNRDTGTIAIQNLENKRARVRADLEKWNKQLQTCVPWSKWFEKIYGWVRTSCKEVDTNIARLQAELQAVEHDVNVNKDKANPTRTEANIARLNDLIASECGGQ